MKLSDRGSAYFNTIQRKKSWTPKEELIRAFLLCQEINNFNEFLRFQTLYEDLELRIKGDPTKSFVTHLFSTEQIYNKEKIEFVKSEERNLKVCGDHQTAQITFFLSDRGEICTFDNKDSLNIIHSSFEKMIEAYALKDSIHNWESNPYYYDVKNLEKLSNFMNQEFTIIEECSDSYSNWWRKKDLITVKGKWLDTAKFYLHVYGRTRVDCDSLVQRLKEEKII